MDGGGGDTLIIFRPLIFGTIAERTPLSCRVMTSPTTATDDDDEDDESNFLSADGMLSGAPKILYNFLKRITGVWA